MRRIFLIVLLFFAFSAWGGSYHFVHFTGNDGLPHQQVEALQFDAKGMLWIGTRNGLSKYDGYSFVNYHKDLSNPNSLNHNFVKSLYVDKKGRLWVGTHNGICRYRPETDDFKSYTLSNILIQTILENSKGEIICAGHQLYRYDEKLDTFKMVPRKERGFIISMAIDRQDRLFVSTNTSIFYYDQEFGKCTQINTEYFDDFITGVDGIIPLKFDTNGRLWIGRNGKGVMNVDLATGKKDIYRPEVLSDGTVRVITEDADGRVWLGTEKGVTIINPDGRIEILRKSFSNAHSLNDNAIYSIVTDRYDNIWMGTYFGGINVIFRENEQFYWVEPGYGDANLRGNAVRKMLQPGNGEIWLATEDGGLNIFNPYTKEVKVFDRISGLGQNIHSLDYNAETGVMWIGTFLDGLYRYNIKTGNYKHYTNIESSGLGSDAIFDIVSQRNGKTWIATTQGLRFYDKERDCFVKINHPRLSRDFVYTLLVDCDDNLWAGTCNSGLFRIDNRTGEINNWTEQTDSSALNDNYISALFQDESNKIWLGTNNEGLRYVDPADLRLKALPNGLSLNNNSICSINEDLDGQLWISTSEGLYRFNKERNASIKFTVADGLPSNQFNFGSSLFGRDSLMYFGTVNGLIYFDPKIIKNETSSSIVHLNELMLNGRKVTAASLDSPLAADIDDTQEIKLTYDQSRSISVGYGVVSPGKTSTINYQMRLLGYDKDWRNVGQQRKFQFFNIAPGRYELQIRANTSNQGWDKSPVKTLSIVVKSPFYYSWWAYMIYFIILVLIAYLLYRYFSIKLEARNAVKVVEMEKKKLEEINEAKMDFFTSVSHELKTPLSLIKAPLNHIARHQKLSKDSLDRLNIAIKNTDKMVGMIDELVQFNKVESGNLQFFLQQGNPLDFIENTARQFEDSAEEKGVSLYVNCENNGEEVWFSPLYVERITNNLISNALKFTSQGGRITVEAEIMEKDDGYTYLRLKVGDTGIGIAKEEFDNIFVKYYQTKRGHNVNNHGWGLGLSLVKMFAEIHKGSVAVESEIGKGATFTVFLNVTASAFPQMYKIQSDKTIVPLTQYKFDAPVVDGVVINPRNEQVNGNSNNKILMLIVEDNEELLKFLVDYFSSSFSVMTAKNGKEALQIARKYPIQLMISDVMMPEMDGFALCRRIKNDISTSHIPVILLTAKNDTADVLKGYGCGAEAYVPKPFDTEILELQIKNILQIRQRQQQRNVNADKEIHDDEDTLNKFDRDFINRIKEIVEKNIDNDAFSIADITESLGISRSLLHVKMKSLLNMSMGDYIRKRRLNAACKLLHEGYNVSETAYKTGFADPNYFSKAFKKEFGMTPSEYIEQG